MTTTTHATARTRRLLTSASLMAGKPDLGGCADHWFVATLRPVTELEGYDMTDEKSTEGVDVAKEWKANAGQESKAKKLRIFAFISWLIAIGTEIAAVVLLFKDKFADGNLALLIGLLVAIAIFAIAGSLMWKAANQHDPARKADQVKFFVQNQLGAIMTLLAFVPLVVLIFLDKDMDPKNKKIAGGVGAALAVIATLIGVSYNPPSVEERTVEMNKCADQINAGKTGKDLTACNEHVIDQAADIAKDTDTVTSATKDAEHPEGRDVVYWITPPDGDKRHDSPRVFHLCEEVSDLEGKPVTEGSVTEAYDQNATRITKELSQEQSQCGFEVTTAP